MPAPEPVLTLYQAEWCPFSAAVRQRLTELGVAWLSAPVAAYPEDRDELRELTGGDTIPAAVLTDGTILVGDTRELLAELDRRFEEPESAEDHRQQAVAHRM